MNKTLVRIDFKLPGDARNEAVNYAPRKTTKNVRITTTNLVRSPIFDVAAIQFSFNSDHQISGPSEGCVSSPTNRTKQPVVKLLLDKINS